MHSKILRIYTIAVVISLLIFSGMYAIAAETKAAEQQKEITRVDLKVSDDGKAIVDQDGVELARFVEDTQVESMTKEKGLKLPGCMRCWYECILYEGERCIKKARTCQWDFDCK